MLKKQVMWKTARNLDLSNKSDLDFWDCFMKELPLLNRLILSRITQDLFTYRYSGIFGTENIRWPFH